MKTLILGLGNELLCDEGVGVHVVRALQKEKLPDGVSAVEVGTAVLDALPYIEEADRIVVIDAMKAGETPGTIYRVPFEDCERPRCIASMHGFDLSRVFFLAGKASGAEAVVIGAEPGRIEWGTELSAEMQAMVPAMVEVVRQELAR